MSERQRGYNTQQPVRPSFGGLTYGSVRPEFVGQPVEDIKASRAILQQRSDVNKQALMDLEKTYGSLVNQVDNSELGYLSAFDKNLNADIQDKLANDEYEYIGPTLLKHAVKLTSDQGLQKRIANKQQYDTTLKAIDSSDYSWEEKVKMKSLPEFQYKPVSQEEDATNTYKDKVYRTPVKQADVAAKLMTYFRNLKPNDIQSGFTHFVKAGADGSNGYSSNELTTSFEESDKTGMVYDSANKTSVLKPERIQSFFNNLANENVDPEIANFLKFKFELANRKPNESNEEFNARVPEGAFKAFKDTAFSGLATDLAYKDNMSDMTIKMLGGMGEGAKKASDDYISNVSSYATGDPVKVAAGASTVEAAKLIETSKLNLDNYIQDQQKNIGISNPVPMKDIQSGLDEGLGLKGMIPELVNDNVKTNAMASTIQDNEHQISVSNARYDNAAKYAIDKIAASRKLTQADKDKLLAAVNSVKKDSQTNYEKADVISEKYPTINPITKFTIKLGALVAGIVGDDAITEDYKDAVDEWYDKNSEVTTGAQVFTKFPTFKGEDYKALNEGIAKQLRRPDFFNGNPVRVKGAYTDTDEFIKARMTGKLVKNELVGYNPVTKEWVVNLTMTDKDGKNPTSTEAMIPMTALKTDATEALMSDPRVKAAEILNSPMMNNVPELEVQPGIVVRYSAISGTSLTVNGELYTDPIEMNQVLAGYVQNRKSEIINGKTTE